MCHLFWFKALLSQKKIRHLLMQIAKPLFPKQNNFQYL